MYEPVFDRADALCDREIPGRQGFEAVWSAVGYTTGDLLVCTSEIGRT